MEQDFCPDLVVLCLIYTQKSIICFIKISTPKTDFIVDKIKKSSGENLKTRFLWQVNEK